MTKIGNQRLYHTLCQVLDGLRREAPPSLGISYYPPAGNLIALIQARSRALLHLFLKARFGMTVFQDREAQITDGPHDGGVDAFHVDSRNKIIYILQSKFRATSENFSASNMSAVDLLKMDVGRILKGKKEAEDGSSYNLKIINHLQKAIKKLPDSGSYTTQVILLGNAKTFTPSQTRKLVDGYQVDQYSHDRIYLELLFPLVNGTYYNDPNLTIEINLSNLKGDTHLDYDVKAKSVKANTKLLFVPTKEVGRIMSTYRNSILKFNPRSFLELQNNPVNQQIEASIKDEASNAFALFNNGLTIICDQTSISSDTAKQGTAQLVIRNPQLVNGGQTAYTLGRIYEECLPFGDFSVFKGKEVLLRLITFVGSNKIDGNTQRIELVGDISEASNSQTRIEESDRRSNDPIQMKLQAAFFQNYGLYYERKRGEFSDGLRSGYISEDLLVNRERIVRVALAADFKINQARAGITKFFAEQALDQLLKEKEVDRYAYGYEVDRVLDQKRREKPKTKGDRFHVKTFGQALRYGRYAVIAACINRGMKTNKSEADSVNIVLKQWLSFEGWAAKRPTNHAYIEEGSFDFVNYYKGSTINSDIQAYPFVL